LHRKIKIEQKGQNNIDAAKKTTTKKPLHRKLKIEKTTKQY
jgi:hypothetical protein